MYELNMGKVGNLVITAMPDTMMLMLAQQMALSLIEMVDGLNEDGTIPEDYISQLWLNMAEHGHVNLLVTHVEFIYKYVQYILDNPMVLQMTPGWSKVALLFVRALDVFQGWKDAHVEQTKATLGTEFGDGGSFNNMDWTNLSSKLLDMFEPA